MRGVGTTVRRALAVATLALVLGVWAPVDANAPRVDPSWVRWSQNRPELFVSVKTQRPVVALTFDDGPDPRWTPRILDALAAGRARATFFDEGEHVERWPELARRTVAAGHEVANHTHTHPDLRTLTASEVEREVRRAEQAMKDAGVRTVRWFRPPKGRFDLEAARGVRAARHVSVGWDVCLERHLRGTSVEAGVAATLARVGPGSIILAHDGGIPDRERTVQAIPPLLAGLRARGFEVVTVSELLRVTRER